MLALGAAMSLGVGLAASWACSEPSVTPEAS